METKTSPSHRNRNVGIAAVVVVLILAIVIGFSASGFSVTQSHTVTSVVLVTQQQTTQVSNNVVNGMVTIGARNYQYYQITVPSGAISPSVSGSFTASGGSGNDIKIYVMDNTNYVNWQNGHSASTYYTSGQTTTGSISAQLPSGAGTYYLVYDNTFSLLSTKNVDTQVNLVYSQTVNVVTD